MVFKFTAVWFKPCKEIAPLFSQLSEKCTATFIEIDIDKTKDVVVDANAVAVPTFQVCLHIYVLPIYFNLHVNFIIICLQHFIFIFF